tara:strand:+ start:5351 stop:5524 length:174 start_codon:yes stop_codon:yes gene_type:complete
LDSQAKKNFAKRQKKVDLAKILAAMKNGHMAFGHRDAKSLILKGFLVSFETITRCCG